MKNYKENLYTKYYSNHTKVLYGAHNLSKLKEQFPVLQYYYGKYLPENFNTNILDLGCGSGDFIYWLIEKGFKNVKGIDISEENIQLGLNLGINNLECISIFDFLKKNLITYDLIILRDVLEHFEREETYQLINKLYGTLNNEGRIIIQTPNGQSPLVGKILYGDFTHNTAFTESSINQLFRSNGFTSIDVSEMTPVPKNLKGVIRFVFWKLAKGFFKLFQLIATGDSTGHFTPNIIAVIKK